MIVILRSSKAFRVVVIAALACSSTANAATQLERNRLQSVWTIIPSKEVPTRVSAKSRRRGLIIGRLLPTELATIVGELRESNGSILLRTGTQIVRLTSNGPPVFCTTHWGKFYNQTYGMNSVGSALCLSDDNRDGEFDRYFTKTSTKFHLLAFAGRCTPTKGRQTTGIKYVSVDPAEFSGEMNVALAWEGGRSGTINMYYQIFNSKGGSADFGYTRGFKTDLTPYRILGGSVSLYREDGVVEMDLIRPIIPQGLELVPFANMLFSNSC